MDTVYNDKSGVLSLSSDLDRANLVCDGWQNLEHSVCGVLKSLGVVNFDLSELGHIDSAGLAWLLNFKRDASADKVAIVFTSVPEKLKQLALLSGVESIFNSEY